MIHINDPKVAAIVPGSNVYELTWQQKNASGTILHRKWRIFIDMESEGTLVGTSTQFAFNTNNFAPASYFLKVEISDGQDSVSHVWKIDIITSVELASFAAQFTGFDGAKITWITSREIDNLGFNILRSQSMNGKFIKINDKLIESSSKGEYQFIDKKVEVGKRYFYIPVPLFIA